MREEKRDRRKRHILNSARRLFFAEGFEIITMRQIADTADLAVGTLYNYFPSKDAVALALFRETVENLSLRETLPTKDDCREIPRIFLCIYEKAQEAYTGYPKSFWREILSGTYRRGIGQAGSLWEVQAPIMGILQEACTLLAESGRLKDEIPTVLVAEQAFGILFMRFLRYINTEMVPENFLDGAESALILLSEGCATAY